MLGKQYDVHNCVICNVNSHTQLSNAPILHHYTGRIHHPLYHMQNIYLSKQYGKTASCDCFCICRNSYTDSLSVRSIWSVLHPEMTQRIFCMVRSSTHANQHSNTHRFCLWIDLQIRRSHGKSSGLLEIPICRALASSSQILACAAVQKFRQWPGWPSVVTALVGCLSTPERLGSSCPSLTD